MLISLNWIQRTWDSIIAWILSLANGISVPSISCAMTAFWPVLILCLAAGLALCFVGFRYHKLVLGLMCGLLFGFLGWQLGGSINGESVSVPVMYALFFFIPGFFLSYLLYFLPIFSGGWLFFLGVMAPCVPALHGHQMWIAAVLAVGYSILYIKFKLVMSAVTGALVLGLLAYALAPAVGAVVVCACIAGGIVCQFYLRRRQITKREQAIREDREKYPYGPGIAYGWEEPDRTKKR